MHLCLNLQSRVIKFSLSVPPSSFQSSVICIKDRLPIMIKPSFFCNKIQPLTQSVRLSLSGSLSPFSFLLSFISVHLHLTYTYAHNLGEDARTQTRAHKHTHTHTHLCWNAQYRRLIVRRIHCWCPCHEHLRPFLIYEQSSWMVFANTFVLNIQKQVS